MADVVLKVGESRFAGWKSAGISRSIESAAATFSLSVSDDFSDLGKPLPIPPLAEVELFSGGQLVVTGYVDSVNPSYDKGAHSYAIAGRSKAADLIDCTALPPGGGFQGLKFVEIAKRLCAPFGVAVQVLDGVDEGDPFANFRCDKATVFQCLERAARQRGLLLYSAVDGALVVAQVSDRRLTTVLQKGVNVLACSGSINFSGRFSEYRAEQNSSTAMGWPDGFAVSGDAVVKDPQVNRYRPLVVSAESQNSVKDLRRRAAHERAVRLGRSQRLTYTVQGWFASPGQLWEPNYLVKVKDSFLGVDAWLLIVSVELTVEGSGTLAKITVMRPEAFDALIESDPQGSFDTGFGFNAVESAG